MKELLLHNEYVELIICFYNVKLLISFDPLPAYSFILVEKKEKPQTFHGFVWYNLSDSTRILTVTVTLAAKIHNCSMTPSFTNSRPEVDNSISKTNNHTLSNSHERKSARQPIFMSTNDGRQKTGRGHPERTK